MILLEPVSRRAVNLGLLLRRTASCGRADSSGATGVSGGKVAFPSSGRRLNLTALPRSCSASLAIMTFCHLRRRASQPLSYRQEIAGGNCKIFSYR